MVRLVTGDAEKWNVAARSPAANVCVCKCVCVCATRWDTHARTRPPVHLFADWLKAATARGGLSAAQRFAAHKPEPCSAEIHLRTCSAPATNLEWVQAARWPSSSWPPHQRCACAPRRAPLFPAQIGTALTRGVPRSAMAALPPSDVVASRSDMNTRVAVLSWAAPANGTVARYAVEATPRGPTFHTTTTAVESPELTYFATYHFLVRAEFDNGDMSEPAVSNALSFVGARLSLKRHAPA